MPSQTFSGKSKEDLVIVARISGLLSDEQAQRMSRTALARFLEAAQTEAEQARQRHADGNGAAGSGNSVEPAGQSPKPATDATAAALAADDTLVDRPARKPAGRRRKASVRTEGQPEQIGLADGPEAGMAQDTSTGVDPDAPPAASAPDTAAQAAAGPDTAAAPDAAAAEDTVAGLAEMPTDGGSVAKPAGRPRRTRAKSTPAATDGVTASENASPEPESPARRPARRTGARKAASPAAPAAESTAPWSEGQPVSGPAVLNALEPVEPTVAQAVALAPQPERTEAPETAAAVQPAEGTPVAAQASQTATDPAPPAGTDAAASAGQDGPVVSTFSFEATAAAAADAGFAQAPRRPGRPPKPQPASPPGRKAAPEMPARTRQRTGGPVPVPVGRTPAQGQPVSRHEHHERHGRLPGGQGTHHSFIPAHHTLTPPAGAPAAERGDAADNRQENRPARQADFAPARPESFQERQSGAPFAPSGPKAQLAPAANVEPAEARGFEAGRGQGQQGQNQNQNQNQSQNQGQNQGQGQQGQGQNQGAPFQRGSMYNASGKMVRPAGEGYAEVGDQPAEGDGQAPAQSAQGRIEGEPGKSRRPFVETGEMVSGVLEIMPDGYGFLRKDNYLQGSKDIYVPPQYIRRFNLREGDLVVGPGKVQRETDRYQALLYIKEVNGLPPERMIRRPNFDKLTPIYPDERFLLETNRTELSTRIIDLVAPIGKGQRGMIVSPPKAGKTILLQKIANAISINNPDVKLIVLLIDERPEEVTDMQRSINGEVVYSTFDKTPENHVKVTELVLARAMRLVELNQDVVILLDSITRMGRAYNLTINPTGRTLSGGLDPGALYGPKRFFGAARNIEGGGSLTIIATALIDTGSRMDEVIFEEFKGTGNMEVYLDRKLSEKRIFPAIDINRSGTRREELLLTNKELDAVWSIRKAFSQLDTSSVTEMIINLLMKTNNNQHFVSSINVSLNDKNIFEAMRGNRPGQAQNGHAPG